MIAALFIIANLLKNLLISVDMAEKNGLIGRGETIKNFA